MLLIEKLSESNLLDVLKHLFPDYANVIVSQKRFKTLTRTFIPDYYIDAGDYQFMFEFDGPTHFQQTKVQLRDLALLDYCMDNKIHLIRIPYFMQLDVSTLDLFFSPEMIDDFNLSETIETVSTTYKSGFHDSKIVYPGDWNSHGWYNFWKLYCNLAKIDRFSVMRDIYDSLELHDFECAMSRLGVDYMLDQSKRDFYDHYPD